MRRPTVIFDFDGTLADTIGVIADLYNLHAADFGADQVMANEFNELRRLGYKKALKQKRLKWRKLPKLVKLISTEMREHMGSVQPYSGVIELIAGLQKRGVSVGILTSNNATLVSDFLQAHQFPLLDFVVSEKTIFGKDKALRKIMKRYHLQPEEVVYVGDEPRDVEACHKAGVRIAAVSWGFAGEELLATSSPTAIVHTAAELQTTLQSWLQV